MRCIVLLVLLTISQCSSSPRSSISEPSQCPTPRLKNGRIRTRGRAGRIIRYSCYAGFELVGNKYSTCIRGSWDTPTPICVSGRCTSVPRPKHAVVGEKYNGGILMYFCEPGYVLVGNAEIYCDGRQWNGTTPYCRDSEAVAPTSCDFEKEGLCWWEQDPKHDFDWKKHRFDTPSSHIGTGPTHDHTLGAGYDGYYLYIEASGKLVNDTARIMSPLYSSNLTESGCFSFWYHMYGATIGILNIYFKPEMEPTPKLMWAKQGNQGNQWMRGMFDLPTVNSSFQIIIEGIRGSSYVSDIAIDDVAILQGEECIAKNITILTTPPPDGDEVEVFNAQQSCRNRCVNTTVESTPGFEVYSNPDICQCSVYCAEESSCCPDYAEFCIYDVPDPIEPTPSVKDVNVSTSINFQTEHIHESPIFYETTPPSIEVTNLHMTTSASSQNSITNILTDQFYEHSRTEKMSSVSLKISSEKFTESTLPTTLLQNSTIHETSHETTTKSTELTNPTIRTSTILSSSPWSMLTIPETTPLVPSPETITTNDEAPIEEPVFVQHTRQLEQAAAFSLSGTVGIVIGVLTGVTIITITVFVFLRKRKLYKRTTNGCAFSEDSDVRFLTSDEILDFNLARPAGEDEET